ncbi:MAG: pyridoxal phosphate-dependent aminotransferase [Desulfobacterota bacterium]|nr:pyridoxal phosphate-dependent aminotransferase [Thermodesulfobacteriota bacterium]
MHLAKRMEHIKPSPTLAVDAKAKALKAQGVDVVGFGAGEPDFDTPDHIKQAAIKALHEGFTKYTPAGGTEELKAAVCEKFKKDNGLVYSPAEILISCGAKHSLYNIFQALLDPGDEVIIPAPYWVSYPDMVYLAGGVPVIITAGEREGFKITPEMLAATITSRTKAFILNSPSNPTGAAYTREELEGIAEVLKKTAVLVISDEIYEKIIYDNLVAHSIVTVAPELRDRAIIVNGVSKTYAMTGWRIGYAAGPKHIIAAMTNIQSQSTSNPTSIAQKAALAALTGPQDFITTMNTEFDRRRRYMVERLNNIPGIHCAMPAGAFYTFPSIAQLCGAQGNGKVITDADAFAAYLLDTVNVAVVSGSAFGAPTNIRLSYATSFETIVKGIDRIEQAVRALA